MPPSLRQAALSLSKAKASKAPRSGITKPEPLRGVAGRANLSKVRPSAGKLRAAEQPGARATPAATPGDETARARPTIEMSKRDNFNEVVREIQQIALPFQAPQARRNFMDSKIHALGGQLSKSKKTPLPTLLRYRQAAEKRLQETRELEKETGVQLQSMRSHLDYKTVLRRRREKELDKIRRANAPKLF